jgi:hypothetical protein
LRNTTVLAGFHKNPPRRAGTSEVVSEDKVRWAIDGFGIFKAAGEDGIFTKKFAACLAYSYIPLA